MGWSKKEEKPKEGSIYHTDLPKDGNKIEGDHPVIIISNNNDDTSRILGCTTKKNNSKDDVEIHTNPPMPQKTYARLSDREREVNNNLLEEDDEKRRLTNKSYKEIKERL